MFWRSTYLYDGKQFISLLTGHWNVRSLTLYWPRIVGFNFVFRLCTCNISKLYRYSVIIRRAVNSLVSTISLHVIMKTNTVGISLMNGRNPLSMLVLYLPWIFFATAYWPTVLERKLHFISAFLWQGSRNVTQVAYCNVLQVLSKLLAVLCWG